MILAVDIGNTNIVLGTVDNGKVSNLCRMETNRLKTQYEYAATINSLFDLTNMHSFDFEGAVVCSVVPPLTKALVGAVKMVTGIDPLVVGTGIKTGLNILIDNPAQLGSDLVAGAVGALHDYSLPIIIIDMGTATTISVVDAKGSYRGGVIAPGVNLSMNALASGTSQLPRVSIEAPPRCIGSNTIDCMQSGAVYGNAAMLDGLIERMENELGQAATVVATGGIASSIIPHCKHEIKLDNDLLLRGMYYIYEKNKKR